MWDCRLDRQSHERNNSADGLARFVLNEGREVIVGNILVVPDTTAASIRPDGLLGESPTSKLVVSLGKSLASRARWCQQAVGGFSPIHCLIVRKSNY